VPDGPRVRAKPTLSLLHGGPGLAAQRTIPRATRAGLPIPRNANRQKQTERRAKLHQSRKQDHD